MAEGVRRITGADIAVAVTGVAGPSGGSTEKPIGMVFFAVSTAAGTHVTEKRFPGDRPRVQRGAAFFALSLVREACRGPLPAGAAARCG
jgi:PncC family amidohydrolase